jgi:lysophospholipase L1-like esterase
MIGSGEMSPMHKSVFTTLAALIVSASSVSFAQLSPSTAPSTAPANGAVAGRRGGRGPAPSATQPAIQRGTQQRHESFLQTARQGDIDLLFIGDSITDFWRAENPNRGGKAVWDKTFAPLKAANFGINADRVQNVLWRVQNGELDGIKPKVIVMMIGTNNLAPDGSRNTPEQTIEGYKMLVNEIRQRQPEAKLLLLAIFPRGAAPDSPYRPNIRQVNEAIEKMADNQHVFFMDINSRFLKPDGSLPAELFPDQLHPNEKGYQIWADAIIDRVKQLMGAQ